MQQSWYQAGRLASCTDNAIREFDLSKDDRIHERVWQFLTSFDIILYETHAIVLWCFLNVISVYAFSVFSAYCQLILSGTIVIHGLYYCISREHTQWLNVYVIPEGTTIIPLLIQLGISRIPEPWLSRIEVNVTVIISSIPRIAPVGQRYLHICAFYHRIKPVPYDNSLRYVNGT